MEMLEMLLLMGIALTAIPESPAMECRTFSHTSMPSCSLWLIMLIVFALYFNQSLADGRESLWSDICLELSTDMKCGLMQTKAVLAAARPSLTFKSKGSLAVLWKYALKPRGLLQGQG